MLDAEDRLPPKPPKHWKSYLAKQIRGAEAYARMRRKADPSRPQPSMPRVAWLERPMPRVGRC